METRFKKDRILKSDKYRESRDVLAALLSDAMEYTADEVDEIVREFGERVFTRRERVEQ